MLTEVTCLSFLDVIAALRFQPTKRPQLPTQKPKPKASFPKSVPSSANNNASNQISSSTTPAVSGPIRPPVKSTLADWTGGDDDVNGFYGGEKRQRGGRKRRKKNKEETAVPQNWDDIYDPSRPNSYEEYKNSDEKIREVREWKDRLYAHRMAPRRSSDVESEDERLGMNRECQKNILMQTMAQFVFRSIRASTKLFFRASTQL